MRRLAQWFGECHLDHTVDGRRRQRRHPRGPLCRMQQAIYPFRHEARCQRQMIMPPVVV
jgi:hypothetical protein